MYLLHGCCLRDSLSVKLQSIYCCFPGCSLIHVEICEFSLICRSHLYMFFSIILFQQLSNEKNLVDWVFEVIILPSSVGIIISHYGDPYETTTMLWQSLMSGYPVIPIWKTSLNSESKPKQLTHQRVFYPPPQHEFFGWFSQDILEGLYKKGGSDAFYVPWTSLICLFVLLLSLECCWFNWITGDNLCWDNWKNMTFFLEKGILTG